MSEQIKDFFLGYKSGMKGYVFYNLKTKEISVTRNAIFSELTFPYPKDPETTNMGLEPAPYCSPLK